MAVIINHKAAGTPPTLLTDLTGTLTQAVTHDTPDTDAATTSLHHTIGASATQAAAGNHAHAGVYSPLMTPEIDITEATTATLNRSHVCTGTAADYSVALPTAAGNKGAEIEIRISNACTKLITLDAYGAELIDGAATRIMWAGETVKLRSDGVGWKKIAGKTIPIFATISCTQKNIKFNASAKTLIALDTSTGSVSPAAGIDTENNKIICCRPGTYSIFALLSWSAENSSSHVNTVSIAKGGNDIQTIGAYQLGSTVITNILGTDAILAKDDYIQLYGLYNGGSVANTCISATAGYVSYLTIKEAPAW